MTTTSQISAPKKPVKNNLEDQPWYHGFRARKDCLNLVKEPGDWLVRASDNNLNHVAEIIISLMDEKKKIQNLTLSNENDKWSLTALDRKKGKKNVHKFDSVCELIDHFKAKPLGSMLLKRAINRPVWLIKHEQIKFDKKKDLLGSGNFCQVFRGRYERFKADLVEVAIKICHGIDETKHEEASQQRKSMIHEAELMSFYSHKHIIQLYGVACDHPPVMIVMEFCPGGNLQDHLLKYKDKIETNERLWYCYEAALGMRYLHDKKCIHRDLASRNCLISERGMIKIADFGLSKIAEDLKKEGKEKDDGDVETLTQIPLRWMAPESLKRPQIFSTKSDVWSFGVLIYEVFNEGVKPWANDENKRIATHIRKGKMPEMPKNTPDDLKQMCSKMWTVEPDDRLTMRDIAKTLNKLCKANQVVGAMLITRVLGVTNTASTSLEMSEDIDEEAKSPHGKRSKRDLTLTTTGRGQSVTFMPTN